MSSYIINIVGNADPVSFVNNEIKDGPILHSIRYYKPSKVYLIYSDVMRAKEDNINLHLNYMKQALTIDFEVISIYLTKDSKVWEFEIARDIYAILNKIDNENENIFNKYIQISGGTAQMDSALIFWSSFHLDYKLIKVSAGSMNNTRTNEYTFNEPKDNTDYKNEINRTSIPELSEINKTLWSTQILKLIESGNVEQALEEGTNLQIINTDWEEYKKIIKLYKGILGAKDARKIVSLENEQILNEKVLKIISYANITFLYFSTKKYEEYYLNVNPLLFELFRYHFENTKDNSFIEKIKLNNKNQLVFKSNDKYVYLNDLQDLLLGVDDDLYNKLDEIINFSEVRNKIAHQLFPKIDAPTEIFNKKIKSLVLKITLANKKYFEILPSLLENLKNKIKKLGDENE